VIEIFEQVQAIEPPTSIEQDGESIQVKPDTGWNINFGTIYPDSPLVAA
jgi:hypothetical protein